jgi:hypothetical protein
MGEGDGNGDSDDASEEDPGFTGEVGDPMGAETAGSPSSSSAAYDDDLGFATMTAEEAVGLGMDVGMHGTPSEMGVGEFGTNDVGLGWGLIGDLANYAVNNPVSTIANLAVGLMAPPAVGFVNAALGTVTDQNVGTVVGSMVGEKGTPVGLSDVADAFGFDVSPDVSPEVSENVSVAAPASPPGETLGETPSQDGGAFIPAPQTSAMASIPPTPAETEELIKFLQNPGYTRAGEGIIYI